MNIQTFIDSFCNLLTFENITFVLSVFGSVGTLITFIAAFKSNRKNLKMIVSNLAYIKDVKTLSITITFENRSRPPISITSARLFISDDEILPEKYPRLVDRYAYRENDEIVARKFLYNINFPVCVQQLGASSGSLLFDVSPEVIQNSSTPLFLKVRSTRGREDKTQLDVCSMKYV